MLKKTGQMENLHGSEFVCTEEGVQPDEVQQQKMNKEKENTFRGWKLPHVEKPKSFPEDC